MKLISFIIPTYNSSNYIIKCLDSIVDQEIENYEILIIDGGSIDNTLDLIKNYKYVFLYNNNLVTAEAAKKIGISKSNGRFICLIDSDNVLSKDYIKRGISLFGYDKDLIGVEPIIFSYNKNMGIVDRYCSLMGINDPMNLYFGNFDKYSVLFNKWTNIKFTTLSASQTHSDDKIYKFEGSNIPTFGANATILNGGKVREYVKSLKFDYYFDNDYIIYELNKKNFSLIFGKVNLGVEHFYCGSSFKKFALKQNRRVRDFIYYSDIRLASPIKKDKLKIILFIIDCTLIFPLLLKTFLLFFRIKKFEILSHIIICLITFYVYSYNSLLLFIRGKSFFKRNNWLKK